MQNFLQFRFLILQVTAHPAQICRLIFSIPLRRGAFQQPAFCTSPILRLFPVKFFQYLTNQQISTANPPAFHCMIFEHVDNLISKFYIVRHGSSSFALDFWKYL